MNIRYIELAEHLRVGGLEKAAADMARYLNEAGVKVVRGEGPVEIDGTPDIVHFHGLWSPAHYRMSSWCRSRRIPQVISPHGMLEPWAYRHRHWKKWPYFQVLEKRRLARADAVLATAQPEAENLRRFLPQQNIIVIPLGIETDVPPAYGEARAQLGWRDDERVLLYLSRVHPKKGLKELMESLLEISRTRSLKGLRLMILGDGPPSYVDLCQKLAARLREIIPVDWVPPQWGDGKWKYLRGSDLFCLPTYSENFGIVMLEAGVVGTPVFTTTGTPWKPIGDNGFGWVVDPDPAVYPEVLLQFMDMPISDLRAMREPFSRWTLENFGWPVLVDRYRTFYETLVKGDV